MTDRGARRASSKRNGERERRKRGQTDRQTGRQRRLDMASLVLVLRRRPASCYCCDAERRCMEVSGAAPDWAAVRELAPLLCCRSAWTTQIGQRLGPFRGGQGLAGGCDCVWSQMPCQCNAQCTANSSGRGPLAAAEDTRRAPPSRCFSGSFSGSWA